MHILKLLLCVLNFCFQDIATVDILERAQSVDPTGQRTIGVLTKTDLIGPGAEDEVIEVVNNRRKPLALGYTMLKNRSQQDIKDGVTTAKARLVQTFYIGLPSIKLLNQRRTELDFIAYFNLLLIFLCIIERMSCLTSLVIRCTVTATPTCTVSSNCRRS